MVIGRIVSAHGLRGQVNVEPLSDFWERFSVGSVLKIRDRAFRIESSSLHKGRPLLKLEGVEDRSAAEQLQWEYLEVADSRPDLQEDEFLVEDLVGLRVFTVEGEELGEVDDVIDMPAHEVLQIGEILVPFVSEFVKDVDLDQERITVQLIPGMRPGEDGT